MDLSSLSLTPGSKHRPMRKGRGHSSGKGETCGNGTKGQMSRKGHKRKFSFEGGQMPLLRRLPKRGFSNFTRAEFTPVNVESLNVFADGTTVDLNLLQEKGIVDNYAKGGVKILGKGKLTRKLTVQASAFSAGAKKQIEAAGGKCEELA